MNARPIVPQPERLNEIFPTTEEVGDCPSDEEGGDGEEEEEPAEQGKGNWLRNSSLPFKGSTVAKPRPPRTGRKPKKRRTPNGCRIYGGAPSSTPPKTPRPNPMWFGSMSRGPRDPPEQGPPKETDNPVETERTDVTAAEVNPPVSLPELPTWQSFKATFARMAREEARAKYVTKKKIKRLERQLIVSLDGNKHILRCGATVGSAYLATSVAVQRPSQTFLLFLRGQVLEDMHAALPSRPLVLCQIRAPEDAAHAADGDICAAAHDVDYDVGVAHDSDSRHGVEGNNSTGDASEATENQVDEGATGNFGAVHDANGYQERPGEKIALLNEGSRTQIRITGNRHVDTTHLRYSLGRALWLSNKPLETTQTLDEFQAAILFLKQRGPTPYSLIAFGKARDSAQESVTPLEDPGTHSTWPYWRPPTSRREDKRAMTDLLSIDGREREATITANTMQQGLRRNGLYGFTSPTQDPADRFTFTELACDEIDKMKSQLHKSEALSPLPTSLTTELQSSPPSGGDDTQ